VASPYLDALTCQPEPRPCALICPRLANLKIQASSRSPILRDRTNPTESEVGPGILNDSGPHPQEEAAHVPAIERPANPIAGQYIFIFDETKVTPAEVWSANLEIELQE
jgi:hypothetical protein